MPKSVLNATRVHKVTQTTKIFQTCQFFPPSMDHQWPIEGPSMEKLFWIQSLPIDGPWLDHAWPCMGVMGSQYGNSKWIILTGFSLLVRYEVNLLRDFFKTTWTIQQNHRIPDVCWWYQTKSLLTSEKRRPFSRQNADFVGSKRSFLSPIMALIRHLETWTKVEKNGKKSL